MRKLKVLSLFDGMSCGLIALLRAGIPIEIYTASEIDKWAIMVSKYNFPDVIHIGDVTKINPINYKDYDLVIGGSPCQSLSVAGGLKGITTNHGESITSLWQYQFLKSMGYSYDTTSRNYFHTSALFWEFVRIYQGIKDYNPDVKFLLENVVNQEWGELISGEMGCQPIRINSSVVSAQNRDRFYWTDIEYTEIPKNLTTLDELIPNAVAGAGSRGVPQKNWKPTEDNPYRHKQKLTVRPDGLANCLTASGGKICRRYLSTEGSIEDINISDAERLQTVPVGYTDVPGVSEHQRFKMLGNGWTIDVITHFFKCMKKEIETKESIVNLQL